jgi:hypothetical protein
VKLVSAQQPEIQQENNRGTEHDGGNVRLPSGRIGRDKFFKSLNACREKQRDGCASECPNETVLRGHIQKPKVQDCGY